MVAVDATLQGDQAGTLVPVQVDGASALTVADATARTTLASILTELGQKLEAGQAVALDATTLAALETTTVGGTVAVSNLPADQKVHDDYQSGECLADQTGAGAVLTFTFSAPVQLVVVDANGAATDVARADPFGGTPTASLGVACRDESPAYMPVTTSTVRVFAPVGMVVSVAGYRRT